MTHSHIFSAGLFRQDHNRPGQRLQTARERLQHIRELEQATGESFLAGLSAVMFVLVVAWAGCWVWFA
jgi:hypothetical protein